MCCHLGNRCQFMSWKVLTSNPSNCKSTQVLTISPYVDYHFYVILWAKHVISWQSLKAVCLNVINLWMNYWQWCTHFMCAVIISSYNYLIHMVYVTFIIFPRGKWCGIIWEDYLCCLCLKCMIKNAVYLTLKPHCFIF